MSESELVGNRYELGELLGRGGMAEVRKGTDTRLGRAVAIKRLRTDLASDATFQARFRREAQASASLNHPAIVSVYDTGEEWSERDHVAQPYIVMEYVAGRTLREILKEGRKILPERALEITSGVLSALDYSHRAGIIHRDIKPGNVMLTPSGDVKVMDFGIARAVSDASNSMTQTAAVVGTAQYLSPEQARGETVDSRSDVYSTGCLLYELLTGRPPFTGDSPVAVAYQHVREPAVPPSDHDTEIPPELDAIALKALAKRVEDRYQSAAAMRHDIERYLAGHPIQATTQVVPAVVDDPQPTAVVPPLSQSTVVSEEVEEPQEERSHRGGWILAGLLLLLLIGLAAWLLPKMFDSPEDTRVEVPSVIGKQEKVAGRILADAGLQSRVEYEEDENAKAGEVIDQSPNGVYVEEGSTVVLTVSAGKPLVTIPGLTNQTRVSARQQLEGLGLTPDFREKESDEDEGIVLSTQPGEGQEVPEGSTVVVFVSDGPEDVPDVLGKQEDVAKQIISQAGFTPEVKYVDEPGKPFGVVTDQTPTGGTSADQDSPVYLFVNQYQEPSETPTTSSSAPTSPSSPSSPSDPGSPTDPGSASSSATP